MQSNPVLPKEPKRVSYKNNVVINTKQYVKTIRDHLMQHVNRNLISGHLVFYTLQDNQLMLDGLYRLDWSNHENSIIATSTNKLVYGLGYDILDTEIRCTGLGTYNDVRDSLVYCQIINKDLQKIMDHISKFEVKTDQDHKTVIEGWKRYAELENGLSLYTGNISKQMRNACHHFVQIKYNKVEDVLRSNGSIEDRKSEYNNVFCVVDPNKAGKTIMKYVLYNGHKYKIRIDGRKQFILVKKNPVFLNTIRGKYIKLDL